jgi:hypothetical protein
MYLSIMKYEQRVTGNSWARTVSIKISEYDFV